MTRPDEDLAPGDHLDPDERDIEAPPADAAEQAVAADPTESSSESPTGEPAEQPTGLRRGLEVGEWDAVEQAIVVDLDDDYDR